MESPCYENKTGVSSCNKAQKPQTGSHRQSCVLCLSVACYILSTRAHPVLSLCQYFQSFAGVCPTGSFSSLPCSLPFCVSKEHARNRLRNNLGRDRDG